jgi:hypothetical protein
MHIFFTVLIAIFGLLCVRLLQKHLHEAKLLQFREMAHSERMKALEQGLPMPADDSDLLGEFLRDKSASGATSKEVRDANERLIRLAALCLGLSSFLGGIGLTAGVYFQADDGVAGMWGIGLIPTMIGVGLLMFVRLSRSFEANDTQRLSSK